VRYNTGDVQVRETGVATVPFDVVRRLGDEKSLRIAVQFEFMSRVNGDARLSAVLATSLDRYQQQTQLDEAEPATSQHRPVCHVTTC